MTLRVAQLLVPFLIAALGSLLLTPVVRTLALKYGAVDHPNPRKIHRAPMPLLGGVAVIFSAVATFALILTLWPTHATADMDHRLLLGTSLGMLPVLVASFWDDVRMLAPGPRFAAQIVGAGIAIGFGVCLRPTIHLFDTTVDIGYFAIPLSMLWIVGVTNAFNLIDGLDGLSAGLALVSAGSLAAVFSVAHQPDMAAGSLIVAGALVGFLPYNVHPAKIFLGDTGAATIGFCLACFALRGGATLSSGFAAAMPIFLMGLPIADTLVAITRRTLGQLSGIPGSRVFQPDRNHFHHRLMAIGLDHRTAVLVLYGVGLAVAAVGLLSILVKAFAAGLLLMGLMLAGFVGLARLGYEEFAVVKNGLVLKFYEAPVLRRSFFSVFADAMMVIVAITLALFLKYDDWSLPEHAELAVRMIGVLVPTTVTVFWSFSLYKGAWRLAGVNDFRRLGVAVLASTTVGFLLHRVMFVGATVPSVFVIYALTMLLLTGGTRISYRVFSSQRDVATNAGIPVLVYGAGQSGARLMPVLLNDELYAMRPVGYLDDDPNKRGKIVNGNLVWGDATALGRAVAETGARRLILATRKLTPENLARTLTSCDTLGLEVVCLKVEFESIQAPDTADIWKGERLPFPEPVTDIRVWAAGGTTATPPASVQ